MSPAALTDMPSSRHDATAEPTTTRDNFDVSREDSITTSTSNTVVPIAGLTRGISTGESAFPNNDRHVPAGKVASDERPEGDVEK